MTTRAVPARRFLESLGARYTLGAFLRAIREGEGWSLAEMGKQIGISRTHLSDIERGCRAVSPQMAATFARRLGYAEEQMVEQALQAIVDQSRLKLTAHVKAA